MLPAAGRARALGRPVVLDPVAAGASALRRRGAGRRLVTGAVKVIRGNASVVRAPALDAGAGSGVDAAPGDLVAEENLAQAAEVIRVQARCTGAAEVLSGALDLMTDGRRVLVGRNGCPEMARATGSGWMRSALPGAFCAARPEPPWRPPWRR